MYMYIYWIQATVSFFCHALWSCSHGIYSTPWNQKQMLSASWTLIRVFKLMAELYLKNVHGRTLGPAGASPCQKIHGRI